MRLLVGLPMYLMLCLPTQAQWHGAAVAGETFGHWDSACFADGYCAATSRQSGDDDAAEFAALLSIGRHGEQTYWEISFEPAGDAPDAWSDIVVDIDGGGETFISQSEVGPYGSIAAFYFVGAKAQSVMDRLMPGAAVAISFEDAQALAHTVSFQLEGLTAALIWIDEQQGRIGSERVAEAPPYGLTPLFADSMAPVEVPVALLDRHRADPECRPFEEIANGRDFHTGAFDADHRLYIIPCDSYAYNFSHKVYIESFGVYYPQYFADYSEAFGWTGAAMLFGVGYDPVTQVLTSFYKGRGIGDCGTAGTWRFDGDALRLLQFTAKDDCEDVPSEDAEIWNFPVVYRAPDYVPPASAVTPGGDKTKN